MRITHISRYPDDRHVTPAGEDLTWPELRALVTSHTIAPCTATTCAGRECPHKKVAAWSPVVIAPGGTRLNSCVVAVTALVADVDHASPAEALAWLPALEAEGVDWVLASSHQHTDDDPRFRLVVRLSRPVTPEEYPRLRRAVLGRLGVPADPKARDLSRIYYLPTARADVAPVAAGGGSGRALDVDAELAAAPPPPEDGAPERPGGEGDWLEDAGGPLSRSDEERLREGLLSLPKRGQGQGTTYAAYSLIFHDYGLGVSAGWPLLVAWNEQCGAPHSPAELERQFYRCARRPHDHRRGWRRGGDVLAAIAAEAARAPEGSWEAELAAAAAEWAALVGAGPAKVVREPLFEPAASLLSRAHPPVRWLARGVVKQGGVVVVGGRSKIGKSHWVKELCVALATGTPAWGSVEVPAAARCAYFGAEDYGADFARHISALLAGRGLGAGALGDRLMVQPRGRLLNLLDDADCALLVASVRRGGGAELTVVEPLRNTHTGKESDSDEMQVVMTRMGLLAELLATTFLVVHHETKPGGSTAGRKGGERLRGSGAVYAAADTMVSLSPVERTPTRFKNLVEVEVRGARGEEDFTAELSVEDDASGQALRMTWRCGRPEPADAADRDAASDAVAAEVERHAVGTLPRFASRRDAGCRCPPGSVLHARDLYERGAHKLGEVPRRRQRDALRKLLDSGRLQRQGGEHGELLPSPARLDQIAAELGVP